MYLLEQHKVKVQAIAFSPSDKYLATIGGQDDNKLVVWDLERGDPICGKPAGTDAALTVKFINNSDSRGRNNRDLLQ